MTNEKNYFTTLYSINVNGHVEVKEQAGIKLTYLSWAWAWAEVKRIYPDAQYSIKKFNDLPYVSDPKTGYMVYTEVTIENITHEMWLPVLDGNNKPMKDEPYEYITKNGKKTVNAVTMFDINKTIMRCLTKNLAMFGLGLYIYAGEDLPEDGESNSKQEPKKVEKPTKNDDNPQIDENARYINPNDIKVADTFDLLSTEKASITPDQASKLNTYLAGLTPVTHDKFFKRIEELYGTASIDFLSEQQAYELLQKIEKKQG